MTNEFYTLQDAVEVLTDLSKDSSVTHQDKIKTDLNTAALILADKGYLVTSYERESLNSFIAEVNSNVNRHTPVVNESLPRNIADIRSDLVKAVDSTMQEFSKAGFHVVRGIDVKILPHFRNGQIDDSMLLDVQIDLVKKAN